MLEQIEKKIPRNVFYLGLVSFFNDLASEMVYPIVPIFLTAVLGAPVAVVGAIEGIAEATASILKVFSGWFSDRLRKRKIFLTSGYSLSTFSKLLMGLAFSWPLVLVARFLDRFGKGVRTSARDALIAEYSDTKKRGQAFGYHRAMDTAGAVLGPLVALLLLPLFNENMRALFFFAFIPGVIGVIILLVFVKGRQADPVKREFPKFSWKSLDPSYKTFLLISAVFALGNSSDAFLILRAKNLGLSVTLTVLAYVLFNFTYSLISAPAGTMSDKLGPRKIMIAGFFLFGLVYLGFGLAGNGASVWILFALYGVYMALTEGIGKAYVSNLGAVDRAGTVLGLYQTIIGVGALLASLLAGALWQYVSVSAPFILGSVTAILAAILFIFTSKKKKLKQNTV